MTAIERPNDHQRGVILIAVLWIIAMMTAIVIGLSVYSQKNVTLAGIESDQLRTEMALQAAISAGEAKVLALTAAERVFLDGTTSKSDLGGGLQASIGIADTSGMIDLNRASPALIEAFAARLETPGGGVSQIAEEILKLREARLARNSKGAKSQQADNTTEQPVPAKPLTAEFSCIAQLYGLPGAEAETVDKLLPFVSLYSLDGKVNPMAASGVVLQSIPKLTAAEIDSIMSARLLQRSDGPAVQNVLAQHPEYLAVNESKVFLIDVELTAGRGIIAGSRMQAIVLLNETGDVPFNVLSWSW